MGTEKNNQLLYPDQLPSAGGRDWWPQKKTKGDSHTRTGTWGGQGFLKLHSANGSLERTGFGLGRAESPEDLHHCTFTCWGTKGEKILRTPGSKAIRLESPWGLFLQLRNGTDTTACSWDCGEANFLKPCSSTRTLKCVLTIFSLYSLGYV